MPEPVPLRTAPATNDASAAILVEDFGDGPVNPSHECCRECGHGALHKAAIVDGTQLIDQ